MRLFFHLFVRFLRFESSYWEVFLENRCSKSSSPEVFLWKGLLKIHSKFTGEQQLWSLKIDNLNQILGRYLWRRSYFVKLQALLKNEFLQNTCFKEHLWWAAYEDFLYPTFYNSIHVKVIQSLNYCPHYLMFRSMKNWNISLIVEYMKILGKSTCFAVDIQVVWKESSDAFVGMSLLLTYGCWLGLTERLIMPKQVALVHPLIDFPKVEVECDISFRALLDSLDASSTPCSRSYFNFKSSLARFK